MAWPEGEGRVKQETAMVRVTEKEGRGEKRKTREDWIFRARKKDIAVAGKEPEGRVVLRTYTYML